MLKRQQIEAVLNVIELDKGRKAIPIFKKNGEIVADGDVVSLSDLESYAYDKLNYILRQYLYTLSYDTMVALQVIMLVGRGDCNCVRENSKLIEDLYEAAQIELQDTISLDKRNIVDYIIRKKNLSEYLENGLMILSM